MADAVLGVQASIWPHFDGLEAFARFLSRISVEPSGCWRWTGKLTHYGYGMSGGKFAHRLSYTWAYGSIPRHLVTDHLCRNRACVNPFHLEAVTARVNIVERGESRSAINARKTHCKRGHEFTPENTNTRVLPAYGGASGTRVARECRECTRAADRVRGRRYKQRKRSERQA